MNRIFSYIKEVLDLFIVNVEGAIRKDDKWIIIERSKEEEHAGGLLSLVGGKVEMEGMFVSSFLNPN